MTRKILCLLLPILLPAARGAAQSVPIPKNPAILAYGPLTVPYPHDWTQRSAKIGEGFVLENWRSIILAGKVYNFGVTVGKDPNPGLTISDYKKAVSDQFAKQAAQNNIAVQGIIGAEAKRKGLSLQFVDVGKWSLDTENATAWTFSGPV